MQDFYTVAMAGLYSRAYHSENYSTPVFDDYAARILITPEECDQIPKYLLSGYSYVKQNVEDKNEALKSIINRFLSPSPLAVSAFTEAALREAVDLGAQQYIIFGAGYDTFSIRQPEWALSLEILEFNDPNLTWDKRRRLNRANIALPPNVHYVGTTDPAELARILSNGMIFDKDKVTFCSIPYMMNAFSKEDYDRLFLNLAPFLSVGSTVALEYPNGAVPAGYKYSELEELMSRNGLQIDRVLGPSEMTYEYFFDYNEANPDYPITAPGNLSYCLAKKIYR